MGQIKDLLEYVFNMFKIWVIIQPFQNALIIRGGKQVREVEGGLYFKIPYFDSVYVKDKKLRVIDLPMQTLTTKDGKTITLGSAAGYSIFSLTTLYDTLLHPESTIANMLMSEIAETIYSTDKSNLTPKFIEESVKGKVDIEKYGLKFEYYKITTFAVVTTYRLIQDSSWMNENCSMLASDKLS